MNLVMIMEWDFDWASALIGFGFGAALVVTVVAVYLSVRSEPPAGGYATFETGEPEQPDPEPDGQQEAFCRSLDDHVRLQHLLIDGAVRNSPSMAPDPIVRFGRVDDKVHVYRAKEWDRPMACVGQTCNEAPFVDGQEFYEIPVADDDTVLLVCVDCATAEIPG